MNNLEQADRKEAIQADRKEAIQGAIQDAQGAIQEAPGADNSQKIELINDLQNGNLDATEALAAINQTVNDPANIYEYIDNPLNPNQYYEYDIKIKIPTFVDKNLIDSFDQLISVCELAFPCYIRFLFKHKFFYYIVKSIVISLGGSFLEVPCRTGKGIGYGTGRMSKSISKGYTETKQAALNKYSNVKNSISNRFSSNQSSVAPSETPPTQSKKLFGIFGGDKKYRKNKLKTRKNKKHKVKRRHV